MATKKKLLQAAAGNAGGDALNVEDVFSTYLYDGTGANQTITNGIDLSGEGGMTWIKRRNAADNHQLTDSERGYGQILMPNATNANQNLASLFNLATTSSGFTIGSNNTVINNSGSTYVSWTFRKAPKFFDVVTYTGANTDVTVNHNLGTTVGTIIVKNTSTSSDWYVWHRSLSQYNFSKLNTTAASSTSAAVFKAVTDTSFTLGGFGGVNTNGDTFVAYLFAHNDGDGDFGSDGDADIIKCGSYTGNGSSSGVEVNLGFEPQWLILKGASTGSQWFMVDNMRGLVTGGDDARFNANTNDAEGSGYNVADLTSTGFIANPSNTLGMNTSGQTYIYIAIRRGTKVPESGTEVFEPAYENSTDNPRFDAPFPVDMAIQYYPTGGASFYPRVHTRLTQGRILTTSGTGAEISSTNAAFDYSEGFFDGIAAGTGFAHMWKRAPNYMDVVAYTGDGTNGRAISHNLGVAPEMMWVKFRSGGTSNANWTVYHANTPVTRAQILLNLSNAASADNVYNWNNTSPTATDFTVGAGGQVNANNDKYIAYLFASLDGISKVGSVTHSGTTNVDCGFTSGARFVLLKRTDATGDWYVWDSERGIVSGNDPYLALNSNAAEVTNTDYIDPLSSGFTITSSFTAGDYIFYAIA